MVLWNALEDLRRRENARRGYVEVKTPLLYDVQTYITSGHYDNYRENMFFVQPHEGEEPLALKPMNCPGHMLLFGSQLRSYRDLPIRYAESSTLHRDERGGTLHGLLRVKHITQDDAHVFVTEEQIQDEIDAMIDYVDYLYDRFGVTPRAELSTRPENRLGTDEQWDHAESALEAALAAARTRLRDLARRGNVLRPEDRPPHDRRARPELADGDDSARLPDAGAVRPHVHGRRQPRALAGRDPPCAARLARAVHGDPHRALRRRVPVLARAGAGARDPRRRGASRVRRARFETASPPRAIASRSTTATRRSASGSATPSSRRCRSSSSTETGSRTTRSPSASGEESSRRSRSTSCSPASASSPPRLTAPAVSRSTRRADAFRDLARPGSA